MDVLRHTETPAEEDRGRTLQGGARENAGSFRPRSNAANRDAAPVERGGTSTLDWHGPPPLLAPGDPTDSVGRAVTRELDLVERHYLETVSKFERLAAPVPVTIQSATLRPVTTLLLS